MKFYVKFGSLRRNGAMFYTPESDKNLFSKFVICVRQKKSKCLRVVVFVLVIFYQIYFFV